MGVVVATVDGLLVHPGGPGAGTAVVAGEVADRIAQLLVTRPAKRDGAVAAGLAGGGATPARHASAAAVGKRPRQLPISASSRAARTVPERGSEVKMCWSGWRVSCSRMWAWSWVIWSATVVMAASNARMIWARALPSGPVRARRVT